MKIWTEKELIMPALVAIHERGEDGLTMTELISTLRLELKPQGRDLEILKDRSDDAFSQKVRNLKSHEVLDKYTTRRNDFYVLNKDGINYLIDNKNLPSVDNKGYKIENGIDVDDIYFSVFDLKRKYDRRSKSNTNVLVLDDFFQREGDIWSRQDKSLLIESILLGIPIPSIFVAEGKNGNLIIIDGRQRLTTIFEFMSDGFALAGLEFMSELNGKKFSQLLEKHKAKIEDKRFHLLQVRYGSDELAIIETFKRVNTQGATLNAQEVRNAIHHGQSTILLNKISSSFDEDSKFAVKKRMKDRLMILRYFAMRQYYSDLLNGHKIEFKSIDNYLGDVMETINKFDDIQIEKMKKDFIEIYIQALGIFKSNAFRLKEDLPINMVVFEITLLLTDLLKGKSDDIICGALDKFYTSDIKNNKIVAETPFEKNIKYHRDSKENIEERLKWVRKIVEC